MDSKGRVHLPFLLLNESSGGDLCFCPWKEADGTLPCHIWCWQYWRLTFLAYRPDEEGLLSSFRSKELSNLVMARPAGFSLWATPNRRLEVRANQASKKASDLVFPAPKTPAIADVAARLKGRDHGQSNRKDGHCLYPQQCTVAGQNPWLGDNTAGYQPLPRDQTAHAGCGQALQLLQTGRKLVLHTGYPGQWVYARGAWLPSEGGSASTRAKKMGPPTLFITFFDWAE